MDQKEIDHQRNLIQGYVIAGVTVRGEVYYYSFNCSWTPLFSNAKIYSESDIGVSTLKMLEDACPYQLVLKYYPVNGLNEIPKELQKYIDPEPVKEQKEVPGGYRISTVETSNIEVSREFIENLILQKFGYSPEISKVDIRINTKDGIFQGLELIVKTGTCSDKS